MTEPPIESARPPEPARRARRQIAGLLVLAFLAGAAADHAAMGLVGRFFGPGHRPPPHGPGGPGPDGGPDHMIERLGHELSLDAATQQKVRAIFDAHRPQFDIVLKDLRPAMKKVRDETDAEVRLAIPAEKREAFDRFIASNRPPEDDMRRHDDGPPRPGDRPGDRPPPPRPDDPAHDGPAPPPPEDRPSPHPSGQ